MPTMGTHRPILQCVEGALNHNTNECKKNENSPAKRANCGNAHPANYKGCDAYKQALTNIGKQPQGNNNGSSGSARAHPYCKRRSTIQENFQNRKQAHPQEGKFRTLLRY
ncbi:hypothetical protein JTB14_022711 [Gonioctena quinquepunctata]|nr:hypothetical protein JTB14_022711 [Gonioctena quinquepunctata]